MSTVTKRLSMWRLAAFCSPCIPLSAIALPVSAYLPNYYASDLGVSMVTLGFAFMAVRFFDLWFDPALGAVMDHTNSRFGRFRPWLVASAPVAMVALYMLFMAKPGVGGGYLLLWLIVGFAGQSMGQLSHMAWASLVAPGYDQRSRVYGWWQAMTVGGMIAILLLPPIATKVFRTGFAEGVQAMGWFAILALPVTVTLALLAVREPKVKPHHTPAHWKQVFAMMKRPSVLRVLGADICWGTAPSITSALLFFYFDAVKGIDRGTTGLLLIVYFLGALAGAPIWTRLAVKMGKHRALMIAAVLYAVVQTGVVLMPGSVPIAIVVLFFAGLPFSAGSILLKAMMADVGDEVRLESGVDRVGLLFSLLSGSIKIGSMIAVGGSQFVLAAVGFQAAQKAANSEGALLALTLMFAVAPAILGLMAAWIISGYRLDAKAHGEVRRQLDERDRLAAVQDDIPAATL